MPFLIHFYIPASSPPFLGIPDFHCHFSRHYENFSHVSCRVVMWPKDVDRMAHWVDPDQSLTFCPVQICLSEYLVIALSVFENKMSRSTTKPTKWAVHPSKTDQPGHPPSLIRVFAVHKKKLRSLAILGAHSEDWSDWADTQADLSLHWAHRPFCWFCRVATQTLLSVSQYESSSGIKNNFWSGPSCSKLTTSLVNLTLKFQTYYT